MGEVRACEEIPFGCFSRGSCRKMHACLGLHVIRAFKNEQSAAVAASSSSSSRNKQQQTQQQLRFDPYPSVSEKTQNRKC